MVCQVGSGPRFINEYDLDGIDLVLWDEPQSPLFGDTRTTLPLCHQCSLTRDCSSTRHASQIINGQTLLLRSCCIGA